MPSSVPVYDRKADSVSFDGKLNFPNNCIAMPLVLAAGTMPDLLW